MKLLAIMRPGEGIDVRREMAPHAREELSSLWSLYRGGVVREMYSPGGPGAILILEAASAGEAHSLLSELPLVSQSIVTLEIVELQPFSAFEMLFSSGSRS